MYLIGLAFCQSQSKFSRSLKPPPQTPGGNSQGEIQQANHQSTLGLSLLCTQRSHFEEVQDPHWEEIEITLKELDGSLVKFQSDSQYVVMLHFNQL